MLRSYYHHLDSNPQYFENSVSVDKIKHVLDAQMHCVLPRRDKYGRRVFLYRVGELKKSL